MSIKQCIPLCSILNICFNLHTILHTPTLTSHGVHLIASQAREGLLNAAPDDTKVY